MFADGSEWELGHDHAQECDSCGAEPGTIHIIRIEDGEFVHAHLCQSCAEEAAGNGTDADIFFAVPTALAGMLGSLLSRPAPLFDSRASSRKSMCAVCGSTLKDVEERGLLGCPACYQAFSRHIEAALGGSEAPEHVGKQPSHGQPALEERREVVRLEHMLKELVDDERYEEAAGVRDRIAELAELVAEEN